MSSLPDVSLSGAPSSGEDVTAAEVPGVYVSDDAAAVDVAAPGGGDSAPSDPAPGDLKSGDLSHASDLPGSDLAGDLMSPAGRGLVVARHWVTQAGEGARQVTDTPGGVFASKPPSFAEYRAYVRSRAWVPEGYDGRVLIWVPVFYYDTIGNAGVLFGYAVAWLTNRMLHFAVAATLTVLALTLWLIFS